VGSKTVVTISSTSTATPFREMDEEADNASIKEYLLANKNDSVKVIGASAGELIAQLTVLEL